MTLTGESAPAHRPREDARQLQDTDTLKRSRVARIGHPPGGIAHLDDLDRRLAHQRTALGVRIPLLEAPQCGGNHLPRGSFVLEREGVPLKQRLGGRLSCRRAAQNVDGALEVTVGVVE